MSGPRRCLADPLGQRVPGQHRRDQHGHTDEKRDGGGWQGVPPRRWGRPVHVSGHILARRIRARERKLFGRGRRSRCVLVRRQFAGGRIARAWGISVGSPCSDQTEEIACTPGRV